MGLQAYLARFIIKRRESVKLWQVFQKNERLAAIARRNFERVMELRCIPQSPALLQQARNAAIADPTLTIGQFLDRVGQKEQKRSKPGRR